MRAVRRPEGAEAAGAGRPAGLRLLLVAPPDGAEAWPAAIAAAGLDPRLARCEGAAAVPAALGDPFDLILAWDDDAGAQAAAVMAAAGDTVPVAVVAHPAAEEGAVRALRHGAAAVLDRDRPARLVAQIGRILETEWLAARAALVGRLAHDLNNLLAPIPLAVRLLQAATDARATRGQIDSVEVATRRSMSAVKELSELLTADPGLPLRARAKYLLVLASRAWRLPGPAPAVLTDYTPDLGSVRVDPVRVVRLLGCLARRAVRLGGGGEPEAGGLVFLGRAVHRGPAPGVAGVEVRVVWIPGVDFAGHRETDSVRPPEPADGLDAVLEVVSAHGWELSVLDTGRGRAGYALLLPSAERGRGEAAGRASDPGSDPQGGRRRDSPKPPPRAGTPGTAKGAGPGRQVLVIDADEEVRRMTREILESAGWDVLTAADGTEGVAVYAQNLDSVATVLVDMTLPYMDGPATIRALRRIAGPATLILTTSGGGDPGRLVRGGDGPDGVLHKPYDADALLQALSVEAASRPP